MRHNIFRLATTIAAAATLVLTVPSVAGAEPGAAPRPTSNPCFFEFTQDIYIAHRAIITGGQATCLPQPDTFHISLTVEYWDGAVWVVTGAAGDSTRPNPFLNIGARDLDCKTKSSYRGHAQLWVAYQGDYPKLDRATRVLNSEDCSE